jgi:hypothetical protein
MAVPVSFGPPPAFAAWRHCVAREGFEVVFIRPDVDGHTIEGHASAVEGGRPWAVGYSVRIDRAWATQRAEITGHSSAGRRELVIERQATGPWLVNGVPMPALDGCADVDLEASAVTNALPVHRLGLAVGEAAQAPAVYVRAVDLTVERLEQRYARRPDEGGRQRYDYAAPRFAFRCVLVYDRDGLVLDYPGLARRWDAVTSCRRPSSREQRTPSPP